MIRVLLSIISLAVLIIFHNTINSMGLNLGLSFTFSKILPYMLEFFAVCLLLFNVYRQYLTGVSLTIRRLVSMLILFGGCGAAFAANPIYEGDFSHQYREVFLTGENAKTFEQGLTMVALPGCPFCFQKLDEMKKISALYPSIPMHVFVINNDQAALEAYRERAEGIIEVEMFPDSRLLKSVIIGGYPNLIYNHDVQDSKLISWSNSGFGSTSWDYILDSEGL
ncbi:hypothetical protein [Brumimicrobium aurantiacum]|nr:hypothetical protein [Brumimicrobium aurantiacum]